MKNDSFSGKRWCCCGGFPLYLLPLGRQAKLQDSSCRPLFVENIILWQWGEKVKERGRERERKLGGKLLEAWEQRRRQWALSAGQSRLSRAIGNSLPNSLPVFSIAAISMIHCVLRDRKLISGVSEIAKLSTSFLPSLTTTYCMIVMKMMALMIVKRDSQLAGRPATNWPTGVSLFTVERIFALVSCLNFKFLSSSIDWWWPLRRSLW